MVGFGLVKVLRSEKDGIKEGDILMGLTPWQKYTVQPYVEGKSTLELVLSPELTRMVGRVDFKPEEWNSRTFDSKLWSNESVAADAFSPLQWTRA